MLMSNMFAIRDILRKRTYGSITILVPVPDVNALNTYEDICNMFRGIRNHYAS